MPAKKPPLKKKKGECLASLVGEPEKKGHAVGLGERVRGRQFQRGFKTTS